MIDPKRYYNPNGTEILDETIFGSNPTGFTDFNRSKYKWAANTYKLMEDNTWFPSEVDTSNENKNFQALSDNEKFIYTRTFAQLSFNDSAQEEYLADFRSLATNKIVKAALTLQMMQEVNHSKSYAVLLDKTGNSDEVFNLYKKDEALNTKNQKIAEQFAKYIQGTSVDEMLLSAMASVNLEGVYFLSGFAYIYLLGDKVQGSRDMIQLIARDEINTHLPMFRNIFKTIKAENKIKTSTMDKTYEMMNDAVNIEMEYAMYLLKKAPIMGLTENTLRNTIHNFANDRLHNIGLDKIFSENPETYLQKLVKQNNSINEIKTNFFEGNVKAYAKNSVNMDDF